MRGHRMTARSLRPSLVPLVAVGAACLAWSAPASAQVVFNNNAINNCLTPGVTQYMIGDGISQGLSFRPCPGVAQPAPVVAAPPPYTPGADPEETGPPPAADTPVATSDDAPAPTPTPVYTPPPPPQRIPVAVPTYSPYSTTTGPGANAVGGGAGTGSYYNPHTDVAATSRAAVNSGDWCRRSGRSAAAMDACLKSVGSR